MQFKKGNKYHCLHDVLIGNQLYFKADYDYECPQDGYLYNTDNTLTCMLNITSNTRWEMYFKEKTETNINQFQKICNQMYETYKMKNADYGNSFDKSCDEFGITAALVRIGDKFNRIKQLTKQKNLVKDESIEDTLLDLANYSIMTMLWFKNNK